MDIPRYNLPENTRKGIGSQGKKTLAVAKSLPASTPLTLPGVTINEENLLNYYTLYWQVKGTIPTVAEVASRTGNIPKMVEIQRIVESQNFRVRAIANRGLPIIAKSMLTPEQFRAIAIITDPTVAGGLEKRLKKAGITYSIYKNWMLTPQFKEAVTKNAELILDNSLSDVNTGLVKRASNGDVNAIKFYYEITGRYNPNDQKTLDVMQVLNGVIEVIQKYVTDPVALEGIAAGISMVAAGNGVPVNTVQGEVI